MKSCRDVRPCLYRVAEGEASPDEAMRTARHLSDCTACRILLARELRLASMLESGLADRVPVGEEFLRSVMNSLPSGPPPKRKPRRVNLKLASFGVLAALLSLSGIEHAPIEGGRLPLPTVPALDLAAPGELDGIASAGRLVAVAIEAARSGLPVVTTSHDLVAAGLAVGGSIGLATLAGLTLFAVATKNLLRV
jgi:anti-sigma factor RsiW